MIKGMEVELLVKTETGKDAFNRSACSEEWVTVKNVLVAQPTIYDRAQELAISGKQMVYTLAIPKGDTHKWESTRVRIFGEEYSTYSVTMLGVEANIPGAWHKQVKVEKYGI